MQLKLFVWKAYDTFLVLGIIYFQVLFREDSRKGKIFPLEALSGPEDSRNLTLPDYISMAQDGGKFASLRHRPPNPQEIHLVLISVEAESIPGS
jgi:hypothetical protein